MFEEENQIENQAEKQVENQENKIDLEKKAGEPAVVKRRLLTRRRRKEDIPAPQASSPAASSSAAPAANPVPESTEGRSKMIINELTQLGLLELRQKAPPYSQNDIYDKLKKAKHDLYNGRYSSVEDAIERIKAKHGLCFRE